MMMMVGLWESMIPCPGRWHWVLEITQEGCIPWKQRVAEAAVAPGVRLTPGATATPTPAQATTTAAATISTTSPATMIAPAKTSTRRLLVMAEKG